MILNFDEYVKMNEGVESVVTFNELLNTIEPLGWSYTKPNGVTCKFTKGKYVVTFHMKHTSSRVMDVGGLDKIRECMIDEFRETGDLTAIKSIDWDRWRLPDPLKRELKDIDPETGKKVEKEPELNMGQKLNNARIEKSISTANELYKNDALWKVDYSDEKSAYIIMHTDEKGKKTYNTCRSMEDRRPLLKQCYSDYKEKNGYHLFGKDDYRMYVTKYYKVLSDGTLDKVVSLTESRKY